MKQATFDNFFYLTIISSIVEVTIPGVFVRSTFTTKIGYSSEFAAQQIFFSSAVAPFLVTFYPEFYKLSRIQKITHT